MNDLRHTGWCGCQRTRRERIGETKCGDGTVIDENMWCANQIADLLAKHGAAAVAYPRSVISTIEGQAKQATLVVMYLGRLTLDANQHVGADGQKHADALKLYACVDRTRRLKKEVEQDSADAKGEFRKGDAGSSHHRQARPPDKASGTIRRISAGGQGRPWHKVRQACPEAAHLPWRAAQLEFFRAHA